MADHTATGLARASGDSLERLARGEAHDPHQVLGHHGDVVRAYRPGSLRMAVLEGDGTRKEMRRVHDAGVYEAEVPGLGERYQLEVEYPDGTVFCYSDPYRFWPTVGELDLHLLGEGR